MDSVEPKIFAQIFFDGVSSVYSGSGRQLTDGLKYLESWAAICKDEKRQVVNEIVREYQELMKEAEKEDKYLPDEDSDED